MVNEIEGSHRLTVETRSDNTAVIICNHCSRPFFEIVNGQIRLLTKHGTGKHENILTLDHLRLIGSVMYQQLHPPERW